MYYKQNGDGTNEPYLSDDQHVQYDGFTKDTYIYADSLEVGATYQMVIYIADISDGVIDSGVFIESCENCDFKLGLSETENSFGPFKMFPNPAKESITIEGEIGAKYILMNAQGKVCFEGVLIQTIKEIQVSHLKPGIYVMQMSDGISSNIEKLVVQ